MIREILTIGDERLLQKSHPILKEEFNTPELNSLIDDMLDTMHDKGGVGIAAVQIGYHKRVLLIEYDIDSPRYDNIGKCSLTVIINPEIEAVGTEVSCYNEGCLSVPGIRGQVERPKHIKYKYYNQLGELVEGSDDGFFARVIQHEIDHLNGVLFPSRVTDISTYVKSDN